MQERLEKCNLVFRLLRWEAGSAFHQDHMVVWSGIREAKKRGFIFQTAPKQLIRTNQKIKYGNRNKNSVESLQNKIEKATRKLETEQ